MDNRDIPPICSCREGFFENSIGTCEKCSDFCSHCEINSERCIFFQHLQDGEIIKII